MNTARVRLAAWAAAGVAFLVLATANGGGYRYGASDQAFYIPVVLRALNPDAFPRDSALIDAQGRLMIFDEVMAGLVRLTGAPLEWVFFGGYLLSMALVWIALLSMGRRLFTTPWGTVALAAAFTLRHRIPRTSANSFEPYFYPRMLAFAFGLLAIAAILHRRPRLSAALVAGAALTHITTGLWFGVLVGVALATLNPGTRRVMLGVAPVAAAVAVLVVVAGPLASAQDRMDAVWLEAVQSKDSLFATDWPLWAWAANLGLPVLLLWVHRRRAARGEATAEDRALVLGGLALAALFLMTLPFVAARWALPTELQISRVFWLLDFLALAYLLALLVPRAAPRRAAILAGVIVAVSLARGAYVMLVTFDERPLFGVSLGATAWQDAMGWLSRQPLDVHVLAHPGHAWKYGTSVRVAAGRDVFVEETKDSALAIYSREVALRVTERLRAVAGFEYLSAARAGELARRYDLDYLVTEQELPLPLAYRNEELRIYRLQ